MKISARLHEGFEEERFFIHPRCAKINGKARLKNLRKKNGSDGPTLLVEHCGKNCRESEIYGANGFFARKKKLKKKNTDVFFDGQKRSTSQGTNGHPPAPTNTNHKANHLRIRSAPKTWGEVSVSPGKGESNFPPRNRRNPPVWAETWCRNDAEMPSEMMSQLPKEQLLGRLSESIFFWSCWQKINLYGNLVQHTGDGRNHALAEMHTTW